MEYSWAAACCFFAEADPDAEAWVRQRALAILKGNALAVAAGIRRRSTASKLVRSERAKADQCAKYLIDKADYLDYPTALASGWPIPTGIIEGACRYLVASGWTLPARAGASTEPKQCSSYEPYAPVMTSTPLALPSRTRTSTSAPVSLRQRRHPLAA